jgi:hypothetical protein
VATVPIGFSAARLQEGRASPAFDFKKRQLARGCAPPGHAADGMARRSTLSSGSLLVSRMDAGAAHGDAGHILCAVRQWASFPGVPTIEGWRVT